VKIYPLLGDTKMTSKVFYSLCVIFFAGFGLLTVAAKQPIAEGNSVAVTVYNDNFAVVKERRGIAFNKGLNTIRFTDVASAIEPASVSFQCLSAPGQISVLEQNYEYDLVGTASLLNRYLDKTVKISIKGSGADAGKDISGTLLAARDNNLIIKNTSGLIEIISIDSIQNISLDRLPEDLVTKPTLIWLAQSALAGREQCQVTYTTGSIGWNADYSAILNAAETGLDMSGWVTIDDKTYRRRCKAHRGAPSRKNDGIQNSRYGRGRAGV